MPSQTIIEDEVKQLNNIIMIDKPAKHALALREKKLIKKLKNCAKESSKKLLILLMR